MTAIKICGLQRAEHALAAAEAGAAMLGFIFAPSRRQVSAEDVQAIRAALAAAGHQPELVGVFVNAAASEMLAVAERCGLDVLQLSGDEPVELLARLPGRRVIKAIRLAGLPEEQSWLQQGPHHDHVRLLVDAHVPGTYGGAGVVADWDRAAELALRVPILLAGGLRPANVGKAIGNVRPWAVDVSSGVEIDGAKDSAAIRAFIEAVHTADREYGITH
jgi:phosphoribosylanthranilate isomerase